MRARGMQIVPPEAVPYKRSRFSTRLPADRLYTPSHYWIARDRHELRIGLTKFATRMLGDMVEFEFQVREGDTIAAGQALGWIEGFKAVTEIYSVIDGTFAGRNDELAQDITLVDSDPYAKGWLYRAAGEPDHRSVDVYGYIAILDATIDRMLEKGGKTDG